MKGIKSIQGMSETKTSVLAFIYKWGTESWTFQMQIQRALCDTV